MVVIEKKLVTAPIGSLRVGQRVIAENPEFIGETVPDVEIDPQTTCLVSFIGPMGDGWFTGDVLFSLDEIDHFDIAIGQTVDFSVTHIALDKPVLVKLIKPCPAIEPDDGSGRRVITAVYRHLARDLIDVQIEGEPDPIGCTPSHPFWSVDRNAFIPAGDLRSGEWVKTAYERTARVLSLAPRGPPASDGTRTAEVVHNLEIAGQHVYHVGQSGVLVHNTGCDEVMDLGGPLKSLLPGEGSVGKYDDLIAAGKKGDNITPNHIPSALHMKKYGIAKGDGFAINMEHPYPGAGGRHRRTFTYGTNADVGLSGRDALALGIRDARRIYQEDGVYGSYMRSKFQELIRSNKQSYPHVFLK